MYAAQYAIHIEVHLTLLIRQSADLTRSACESFRRQGTRTHTILTYMLGEYCAGAFPCCTGLYMYISTGRQGFSPFCS